MQFYITEWRKGRDRDDRGEEKKRCGGLSSRGEIFIRFFRRGEGGGGRLVSWVKQEKEDRPKGDHFHGVVLLVKREKKGANSMYP